MHPGSLRCAHSPYSTNIARSRALRAGSLNAEISRLIVEQRTRRPVRREEEDMASIQQSRNYPPEHGIIVPIEHQHTVIRSLLGTTAMRGSDADFLAEVLLTNETRCIYSHGSRQLPHYWRISTAGGSIRNRR